MADKELLKSVLNDLINDKHEQASVSLHSYLTTKTQEVAGLAQQQTEVTDDEVIETDDDEVVETE